MQTGHTEIPNIPPTMLKNEGFKVNSSENSVKKIYMQQNIIGN